MNHLLTKIAGRARRDIKTENGPVTGEPRSHRVLVVGVGSAGVAALEWVFEDTPDASTLAVNTDRISLEIHRSEVKMLIGQKFFHGRGALGHAEAAARAARAAEADIANFVKGFDIVAVLTALGGGTGSGAAPVIAAVARAQGAVVVAVAVLPFKAERSRRTRALEAFGLLRREAHTTILLDSEALLPVAGDLPVATALGVMDYFMSEVPRSIVRTIQVAKEREKAVVETREMLQAGGLGTLCYAEWGASGVLSAVPHRLSQAAGGARNAALIHIDSPDGLFPEDHDTVISRMRDELHATELVHERVRLSVARDPALHEGGRIVSIVTGLGEPSGDAARPPTVTIEPTSASLPPIAPGVSHSNGPEALGREPAEVLEHRL